MGIVYLDVQRPFARAWNWTGDFAAAGDWVRKDDDGSSLDLNKELEDLFLWKLIRTENNKRLMEKVPEAQQWLQTTNKCSSDKWNILTEAMIVM